MVTRAEHLRIIPDNRYPLGRMVLESGVRLEVLGEEVRPSGRFRFRELCTPINGSGPTDCLLVPIGHHQSVDGLIVSLADTGVTSRQYTTLRHALCLVCLMEVPHPTCMHCNRQVVILQPNVFVWDTWFKTCMIPMIAILTDVPVWPTVRLVLHNRLASVLGAWPARALLRE